MERCDYPTECKYQFGTKKQWCSIPLSRYCPFRLQGTQDKSKDKIKPCPFCGSKAKAWKTRWKDDEEQTPINWTIGCSCGCALHQYYASEADAIKAWNTRSNKSPSPCRHTLEDGADTTTELVSGKSSGFIGGMRQEKASADEKIDINHEKNCWNCFWFIRSEYKCHKEIPVTTTDIAKFCKFYDEQTQGHKRIGEKNESDNE